MYEPEPELAWSRKCKKWAAPLTLDFWSFLWQKKFHARFCLILFTEESLIFFNFQEGGLVSVQKLRQDISLQPAGH